MDNIDLMGDWVVEEPTLLNPDDINWDCLNEPVALGNVEEDTDLETIDVDDNDDDDNIERGLTNLPMGLGSSCGSSLMMNLILFSWMMMMRRSNIMF